jgi:hypothetical protein
MPACLAPSLRDWRIDGAGFPALERWAINQCAYGALRQVRERSREKNTWRGDAGGATERIRGGCADGAEEKSGGMTR